MEGCQLMPTHTGKRNMARKPASTHPTAKRAIENVQIESRMPRIPYPVQTLMAAQKGKYMRVIQRIGIEKRIIIEYIQEVGLMELPEELIDVFFRLVNSAPNPDLRILDKILDRILKVRAACENEEHFQSYLASLKQMLDETGNSELDVTPFPYRDSKGEIMKAEEEYSFTGLSIAERLNGEQTGKFNRQIVILKQYCDKKGILKTIAAAAINVKRSTLLNFDFSEEIDRRALDMFVNRLELMTEFIKSVGEEKMNSQRQRKIKDVYWIESTGSDPHQGGHHALFLIERTGTGNKRLYKPHSLRFEDSILGENGLLAFINRMTWFENRRNKLPVMDIQQDSHQEEFIIRSGGMKNPIMEAVIQEQFYKLGLLEAVMRMAGITDLHCENITFSEAGPVPVDAECGASFCGTQIESGALLPGTMREDKPFCEGGLANPSALYRETEDGEAEFAERSCYQPYYENGRRYMEEKLFRNKEKVLSKLRNSLELSDCCRIVPIATDSLANLLDMYLILDTGCFKRITDIFNSHNLEDTNPDPSSDHGRMLSFCQKAKGALQDAYQEIALWAENPYSSFGSYLQREIQKAEKRLEGLSLNFIRLLQIGEDDTIDPVEVENSLAQGYRNEIERMRSIRKSVSDVLNIESKIDGTYEEVLAYFNNSSMAYMKEGETQTVIDRGVYNRQFLKALQAGTLPAFSLQLRTAGLFSAGAIILDGYQIGQVFSGTDRHVITDEELLENYIGHARAAILDYEKSVK